MKFVKSMYFPSFSQVHEAVANGHIHVTCYPTVLESQEHDGDKVMDIVCNQQAGVVKSNKYIQKRTFSPVAKPTTSFSDPCLQRPPVPSQ
jgi:hypothetical protein